VGAMSTLQRRFPHAVELSWQPEGGLLDLGGTYASRVSAVDDLEGVSSFVRHVRNSDPDAGERDALREALDDASRRRVEV
jgi:exonuclease SbcD